MNLTQMKCEPCEGGVDPMDFVKEEKMLQEVPKWEIKRDKTHQISRTFSFDDFNQSMSFVNEVARIAEEEGHHPNIHIFYNEVELVLYTHAIGGLSQNDFIVAAKVDEMLKNS